MKYSLSIAPVFGDDKKDSEQDIKDVSEKLGDKPDNLSLDITEIAGTVTELSDSDLSADELSDENMFEKSAPGGTEKCGWKYQDKKIFRKQIKTEGKKCYKGAGKCLN